MRYWRDCLVLMREGGCEERGWWCSQRNVAIQSQAEGRGNVWILKASQPKASVRLARKASMAFTGAPQSPGKR
jgi:hypothetical protein